MITTNNNQLKNNSKMKKFILSTLLVFSLINITHSQWVSNFGSITQHDVNVDNSKGNAITSDILGNSYVTGYSNEGNSGNDIITIKYNLSGMVEWSVGYDGTAHTNDEGTGICTDAYGNVYVVGTSTNYSRNTDLTIIKYNAFGAEVWSRIYGATESNVEDKGVGITVDSDCNVYVTGYTTNYDGYTDVVTQKYDSQGNHIWTGLEDGDSGLNGQGLDISVGPTGNVYVSGYVTSGSNGTDILVIKYNSSGNTVWTRSVNGGANSEDKAWGIVVDNQDNIHITGYTTELSQGTNTYTSKLNSSGTTLWTKNYNGTGNQTDKAWGMVVDTDGSVYITGETYTTNEGTNYLTIKYSQSGYQSWVKTYNGTGAGTDAASSICIVSGLLTKTVVVTGKSWGSSDTYDYATVRYNAANGQQSQVNRYSMSGTTDDIAKAITTTLTKVIVTGFSQLITEAQVENSVISTQSLAWGEESEFTSVNNIPEKFELFQNYPNPFNPSTTINFDLPFSSVVKLTVYDILGKQVSVLVNQQLEAGSHKISYSNINLSSGVYFYELRAGNFRDIKKMNLIK
jgi:uncharacterized delta-60 repeat protein